MRPFRYALCAITVLAETESESNLFRSNYVYKQQVLCMYTIATYQTSMNCLFFMLPAASLLYRMGVKKLWTYLKAHQVTVFQEIDLAEEARRKGATEESRAELWCDYGAVVRQLETALLKERQPKFCSYYGCDTRLLGQQMEAFIKALRSIHVEPVFVSDGPPGADAEGFQAKYAEIKSRQEQRQGQSREWEAAVISRSRHKTPSRVTNPQCFVICDEVLRVSKVRNLVTHCEADTVLIHRCGTSLNALGILSGDTDFAVAENSCAFFPLEFFDHRAVMGFHKAAINDTIHSLPCRYTNRQLLAKSLPLRDEDMTMFAILCGNDYTGQYVYKIKQNLGIQKPMGPAEVAWWLNQNRPYAEKIEKYRQRDKGFQDACQVSIALYSGKETGEDPLNISEPGILSPMFLSIEKGVFLQAITANAQSAGDALPYIVSKPIRSTVYALFGRTKVNEYGFHSNILGDFGQIPVTDVVDLTDIREILRKHPFFTRAAALHHLISTPLQSLAEIGHAGLERNAPADLPPDEDEVLRGIIAVSAVAYLMPVKELRLDKDKVQASLLAFAATSAGVRGDVDIGHPDPDSFLRAVSLSSTISVTLLSLYYIAELLDLSPKASDIFGSSVFVPAYMAVMCYLPAGIPDLAPVVGMVHSPHTTALVGYIQTMQDFQDKPKLSPPELLTGAVRSYTALVDEMKALVLQEKQGPSPVAMPRQPRVAIH